MQLSPMSRLSGGGGDVSALKRSRSQCAYWMSLVAPAQSSEIRDQS